MSKAIHNNSAAQPWLWAVLAAFLASPLLSARLRPNDYQGGRSRNVEARALRNTSSVAAMLGEFRTALSDMMYIKTERYLHCGVGYVPHLQKRLLSVTGAEEHLEAHHHEAEHDGEEHDHHEHHDGCAAGTPTLIKTPDQDFRGFIGDLQRKVKPWKAPSVHVAHGDGTEMLPWYRLMTLSDPHYIRGYTLGGWWLKGRATPAALRFVEEGIRNNPDAFQIYLVKGQILIQMARDREAEGAGQEATVFYRRARDTYRRAAELAVEQRPAHWAASPDDDRWTEFLDEDARTATRMAVLLERRYGRPETARRWAQEYHEVFGDDLVLKRLAHGQSAAEPLREAHHHAD